MSGFRYNLFVELPSLQYKMEEVISIFQQFIIECLKKDGIFIKKATISKNEDEDFSDDYMPLNGTVSFYEKNDDDFPYASFYFFYELDFKSDTVKYIQIIDSTSVETEMMSSDGFFKNFVDMVLPSIDMVVAALLVESGYDLEGLFLDLKTNRDKFDVSRGIYP